jgi:hypothetical protein
LFLQNLPLTFEEYQRKQLNETIQRSRKKSYADNSSVIAIILKMYGRYKREQLSENSFRKRISTSYSKHASGFKQKMIEATLGNCRLRFDCSLASFLPSVREGPASKSVKTLGHRVAAQHVFYPRHQCSFLYARIAFLRNLTEESGPASSTSTPFATRAKEHGRSVATQETRVLILSQDVVRTQAPSSSFSLLDMHGGHWHVSSSGSQPNESLTAAANFVFATMSEKPFHPHQALI